MEHQKVLPLWVRVDQGVMAIKEYCTFFNAPELQPHHQIQCCVIPRTHHRKMNNTGNLVLYLKFPIFSDFFKRNK